MAEYFLSVDIFLRISQHSVELYFRTSFYEPFSRLFQTDIKGIYRTKKTPSLMFVRVLKNQEKNGICSKLIIILQKDIIFIILVP